MRDWAHAIAVIDSKVLALSSARELILLLFEFVHFPGGGKACLFGPCGGVGWEFGVRQQLFKPIDRGFCQLPECRDAALIEHLGNLGTHPFDYSQIIFAHVRVPKIASFAVLAKRNLRTFLAGTVIS